MSLKRLNSKKVAIYISKEAIHSDNGEEEVIFFIRGGKLLLNIDFVGIKRTLE